MDLLPVQVWTREFQGVSQEFELEPDSGNKLYKSDTVGTVFGFHENVSVLYLGYLPVHELLFSLLTFLKSKRIAQWQTCGVTGLPAFS